MTASHPHPQTHHHLESPLCPLASLPVPPKFLKLRHDSEDLSAGFTSRKSSDFMRDPLEQRFPRTSQGSPLPAFLGRKASHDTVRSSRL